MNLRYLLLLALTTPALAAPTLHLSTHPSPREQYAATLLEPVLASLPGHEEILLATRHDPLLAAYDKQIPDFWPDAREAFLLRRLTSKPNTIIIAGFDPSGVLYGTEELISRINSLKKLPTDLDLIDHPQLKLRGDALGLQRPEITYEGAEYDYPYTPKEFPWFYDKAAWTAYLDRLARQRINTLYLWSGHPFTSLLKLPKYPEAQELPTPQLEQNIAMYQWLTQEADKRGIWVLQGFYNIHLSHTFARAHNLPFHLSAPSPLSSDYTRYCISEFIRSYPNVGIFMTLGEAMGPHYGPEWITKTIIPGVKDGLAQQAAALGHPVPDPPIVIRAHATDIEDVMPAARALYSNIDTMWKWNGESYTWTNIRGPVLDRFKKLVAGSNTTIVNMHLMSNLEPFRWGNPDFVRQTVANFVRIGIGGVHLYPLRYWDWPYSADNTTPLLQQPDRDWIWYDAWARYAWNPERDPKQETAYWTQRFAERFTEDRVPHPRTTVSSSDRVGYRTKSEGSPSPAQTAGVPHSSQLHRDEWDVNFQLPTVQSGPQLDPTLTPLQLQTGAHLLAAYELSGICAPTLLPRIGITEGNRQVLSLGMTMPQLIDAKRFNPAETLWTGDAPDGERLDEYVASELAHKPHHGQTPIAVAQMVAESSQKAVAEAELASPGIAPAARPEYDRILNDTRAIAALMAFYNHKTQAAVQVMEFASTHSPAQLRAAEPLLAASVEDFKTLTALTEHTYRDSAGMETSQRQIPVRGGPTTNHWRDLLPVYQTELTTFRQRLGSLNPADQTSVPHPSQSHRDGWDVKSPDSASDPKPLPQIPFTLAPTPNNGQTFTVAPGQALYSDSPTPIATVAPELNGLTGIRVSTQQSQPIHFTLAAPAQILVGFFKSDSRKALNASPTANVSAATEQWNILLPNAITVAKGLPITVWTKPLPAGQNDLDLGKGAYLVLGFIPEDLHVTPHINFSTASKDGLPPNLDWLFEN